MKYKFPALVAFVLLCTVARATTFDFTYTFLNGDSWTGTLIGTQSGLSINNISSAVLDYNGVSVGAVTVKHWTGTNYLQDGLASISTNNSTNDFLFQSSSFSLVQAGPGFSITTLDVHGFAVDNGSFLSGGHVSISAVPDEGMTGVMLGAGLIGLIALRRKRAHA